MHSRTDGKRSHHTIAILRKTYEDFLNDDQRRKERNRILLTKLDSIQQRAALLQNKTDRIKSLKVCYGSYTSKPNIQTLHDIPVRLATPTQYFEPHAEARVYAKRPEVLTPPSPQMFLPMETQFLPYPVYAMPPQAYMTPPPPPAAVPAPITVEDIVEKLKRDYVLVPKTKERITLDKQFRENHDWKEKYSILEDLKRDVFEKKSSVKKGSTAAKKEEKYEEVYSKNVRFDSSVEESEPEKYVATVETENFEMIERYEQPVEYDYIPTQDSVKETEHEQDAYATDDDAVAYKGTTVPQEYEINNDEYDTQYSETIVQQEAPYVQYPEPAEQKNVLYDNLQYSEPIAQQEQPYDDTQYSEPVEQFDNVQYSEPIIQQEVPYDDTQYSETGEPQKVLYEDVQYSEPIIQQEEPYDEAQYTETTEQHYEVNNDAQYSEEIVQQYDDAPAEQQNVLYDNVQYSEPIVQQEVTYGEARYAEQMAQQDVPYGDAQYSEQPSVSYVTNDDGYAPQYSETVAPQEIPYELNNEIDETQYVEEADVQQYEYPDSQYQVQETEQYPQADNGQYYDNPAEPVAQYAEEAPPNADYYQNEQQQQEYYPQAEEYVEQIQEHPDDIDPNQPYESADRAKPLALLSDSEPISVKEEPSAKDSDFDFSLSK